MYKRNKKYEAEETSFNMFRSDDIEMKTTKELENGAEGRARRSGEDMLGGEDRAGRSGEDMLGGEGRAGRSGEDMLGGEDISCVCLSVYW